MTSPAPVTVLCIQPDGESGLMRILGLEAFRQAIGGGWLESVTIAGRCAVFCDEEGKIKGMPVNPGATHLARTLGWRAGDVLCGPVLFVGLPDRLGDETSVPDEVINTWAALRPSQLNAPPQ